MKLDWTVEEFKEQVNKIYKYSHMDINKGE